jgi:hypothetical protein
MSAVLTTKLRASAEQWRAKLSDRGFDLAETTGFIRRIEDVPSFDERSDDSLREQARSHSDPIERERALWELAYRLRGESVSFLADTLGSETNPAIRWNLLWLAVKVGREGSFPLLESALSDDHREVRDWTKLFLRDLGVLTLPAEYTEGVYTTQGAFDQTLPLQIAGFAIVDIPGLGTRRVVISPMWFESIMGRVMACTNVETFMSDLVVEKELKGYHIDGSNHYEIYPFKGVSWPTSDGRMQHRYESSTRRTFYRSGKAEDRSEGVDSDLLVAIERTGTTRRIALPVSRLDDDLRVTDNRGLQLRRNGVVESVSGQFFGWAHASIKHYLNSGKILAGTVQLGNPGNDATRGMINTYLCGTFRGKLSDHDGDGRVDVNLVPCHGTVQGVLDYLADGKCLEDPHA